jgi:phosphoglycolate phosphatase-like HAD superfamily hydrolase
LAEVLNPEIKKLDFVIFDFDGTLMQLDVDWTEIRSDLDIDSVEEIWGHSEEQQLKEWEKISSAELEAFGRSKTIASTSSLLPDLNFGVLTNNCEEVVTRFLFSVGINPISIPIIGRNWLKTSKKNFGRFSQAVSHITSTLSSSKNLLNLNLGYMGDSTYELDYALELGFQSYLVKQDGSFESYRRIENE